jgi:hypothetical protein
MENFDRATPPSTLLLWSYRRTDSTVWAVARVKKGGSRPTRVIKNGPFSFLGCDPGRDFLTRADPG